MGTGKRVALLVNGPSLTEMWNEGMRASFDVVIAMNTAGWLFDHDYAVITDPPLVKDVCNNGKRHPRVAMVCYTAHKQRLSQCGIAWLELVSIPKVKSYTFPRAIVFSLKQAGSSGTVELFGVDWTNTATDVAGIKGQHDATRWGNEAPIVRQVWDQRIRCVHGHISAERLDYFAGRRQDWPQ